MPLDQSIHQSINFKERVRPLREHCNASICDIDKTSGFRTNRLGFDSHSGEVGGAVRHNGPWLEQLKAFAPMASGVDVVLDPVASGYAESNLDALRMDGRWVLYSLMSGASLPDPVAKSFLGSLAAVANPHPSLVGRAVLSACRLRV